MVTTTAIETTNKTSKDPPIAVDMVFYQNIAKILEGFGIYDVDILKELSLS